LRYEIGSFCDSSDLDAPPFCGGILKASDRTEAVELCFRKKALKGPPRSLSGGIWTRTRMEFRPRPYDKNNLEVSHAIAMS
jgi:hypothetical protein